MKKCRIIDTSIGFNSFNYWLSEVPNSVLPGSSDNSGSKKQMHTFLKPITNIRSKYPWKQVSEYPRNYFSRKSLGTQSGTTIKRKRKTLVFRLVNYKYRNGFNNDIIGRRYVSNYSRVRHSTFQRQGNSKHFPILYGR